MAAAARDHDRNGERQQQNRQQQVAGARVDRDRCQQRAHHGQPDIREERHHGAAAGPPSQNPSSMKKRANTGSAISSSATR